MDPLYRQQYDQIEIDDNEEDQLIDTEPEPESEPKAPAPVVSPSPSPSLPPPANHDSGKDIDPDSDSSEPRYVRIAGETAIPMDRLESMIKADGLYITTP